MRPLYLDYRRDNLNQHWIGMLVLTLVLLCVVALGVYYRNVYAQTTSLEALVAKIEQKLHPGRSLATPSAAEAQLTAAEIKTANEVVLQLNLPWNQLFNALEEANNKDIALLGIEPNARKGLVQVSGEAKNVAALFSYIRLLQSNKSMSAVYLKHQQTQEQNPEKPIRFTLDASWT